MYNRLLEDHFQFIEETCEKKKNIIVYKGFPVYFVLEVSKKYSFLNEKESIFTNSKIDLQKIDNNKQSSISKLLQFNNEITTLLYEEFISIVDNVNLELFDGDFIIFNNFLFNEYPNQSTIKYIDIEKEIDTGNLNFKEDELFKKFYTNSISKNNISLVQYRDISDYDLKNVKIVDFLNEKFVEDIQIIEDSNLVKNDIDIKQIEFPLSANQENLDYYNLKIDIFNNNKIKDFALIIDKAVLEKAENRYKKEAKTLCYIFKKNNKELKIKIKKNIVIIEKYRNEFYEILEKYWNSKSFRDLLFYSEPDLNKNKVPISQGSLIEFIVKQAEKANKDKDFNDIYITAPTGSGKSILFQILSLYLAEKYNFISIIVTPLKALMYDQVTALKKRGIESAEFINSDITLIQRQQIIERIQNGKVDILYLSPELLLSYDLKFFIGDRNVGLLVVDESHLVTTWGRDFRVDYWYLGGYIQKIRKYFDKNFPVLTLTATAVYLGPDDIVFETTSSLNMRHTKYFIGNMRRDEIIFDIRPLIFKGNHDAKKIEITEKELERNIDKKIKTIVYCPWTNQVDILLQELPPEYVKNAGRYYAKVEPEEKELVMDGFKDNRITTIIATKAFGMGIDIDDIREIYHLAPSGNLYDYVQEIGRVARDENIEGNAVIDFNIKDLKYTKILYGLSSIKQYQIKSVMQKIYDLFLLKGEKQNMLVSPEDFGFIFFGTQNEYENKVKSALLLLEKDLIRKYKYNVIITRPKSLFTTVYACVDEKVENEFIGRFEKYVELVSDIEGNRREDLGKTDTRDLGNIYKIELNKLWEDKFSDLSFPQMKRSFFKKELFENIENSVIPRYKLKVMLYDYPDNTIKKIEKYFEILNKAFDKLVGGFFGRRDLEKELKKYIDNPAFVKRISNMLLTMYTSKSEIEKGFRMQFDTFIQQRKSAYQDQYRIIYNAYEKTAHFAINKFNMMYKDNKKMFLKYISANSEETEYRIKIAYLIEAFKLGNYELIGGQLPQIFIRINDPFKLKILIQKDSYSNEILQDVDNRHKRGIKIMEKFFTDEISNKKRWDFIEKYFMGESVI